MRRLRYSCAIFLAGALWAWSAATHAQLVEGRDFLRVAVPEPPTARVVVLAFFSYGCSACFNMHPLLRRWESDMPAGVVMERVAVANGRKKWAPLARTFYAMQNRGALDQMDTRLFEALHTQRQELFDEDSIAGWVSDQGLDRKLFLDALRSEVVTQAVDRAEQRARRYQIAGTPTVIVDGQYIVKGSSYENFLLNLDSLVHQALRSRAESFPKLPMPH